MVRVTLAKTNCDCGLQVVEGMQIESLVAVATDPRYSMPAEGQVVACVKRVQGVLVFTSPQYLPSGLRRQRPDGHSAMPNPEYAEHGGVAPAS